jgi:hypothetical protein
VLGGVRSRVLPRLCGTDFGVDFGDDLGVDFELAPDLGAARPVPLRPELWARGFFEGPHVFIVESTVPTRRAWNRASRTP